MRSIRCLISLSVFVLLAPLSALAQSEQAVSVPAAPETGGPRYWRVSGAPRGLNLREAPSVSARRVAAYAEGTILNNLGCEAGQRRAWCDVQELGGGPRGYVAADYLAPAAAPDGTVPSGPDTSALRAGQGQFDATGQIPCAGAPGQAMSQCDFGVARSGGGDASVVVTRPDGHSRAIFFQLGRAVSADSSQADGYGEFRLEREGDLSRVSVGEERYEIPDELIFSGASEAADVRAGELEGTRWRLVKIMSMDDRTWEPDDEAGYTLEFGADGAMSVRADCNRGSGTWSSESPGQLRFGVIAATMAACPPGSLHDRYMMQFEWVRSYVLREGHLYLATMADGAIIEFEPQD